MISQTFCLSKVDRRRQPPLAIDLVHGQDHEPFHPQQRGCIATTFHHVPCPFDPWALATARIGGHGALLVDGYGRVTWWAPPHGSTRRAVNRYYDPSTYQFLSIDPKVGTTLQPYAFVGGDPLNATDPLGLYTYRYREYLPRRVGGPKIAMKYLKRHVRKVFPFKVTGGSTIKSGESLVLHPGPSGLEGVGTVEVKDVTSTSFTFDVKSSDYFDPPGSKITFSTGESHGQTYLQEYGDAPNENASSDVVAPQLAKSAWSDLADNLTSVMGDEGACNDSFLQSIGSYISGVNAC